MSSKITLLSRGLFVIAFLTLSNLMGQVRADGNIRSFGKTKDGNFRQCFSVRLFNDDSDNDVCSPQITVDLSSLPNIDNISITDLSGSGFDISDLDTSASGFSTTNPSGTIIDPTTGKCLGPNSNLTIVFTITSTTALWPDGNIYNWSGTVSGNNVVDGPQTDTDNEDTQPMYDSDIIPGGALEVFQGGSPLGYNGLIQPNLDGTYDFVFRVTLGNYDNDANTGGTANNITYTDELNQLYNNMPINSISVSNSANGLLTVNPNYNGNASTIGGSSVTPDQTLVTDGTLAPDQEDYVDITLNVGPIPLNGRRHSRWTTGFINMDDTLGTTVFARTTDGEDPTWGLPEGPSGTCRNGLGVQFDYQADFNVSKTLVGDVVASSGTSGNRDLTYRVTIEADATNDVNVYRLSAIDPVANIFGASFVQLVSGPTVTNVSASNPPSANTGFDGATGSTYGDGVDLLVGNSSDILAPGQSLYVEYTIEVSPDNNITQNLVNGVDVTGDNVLNEQYVSGSANYSYVLSSVDPCDPVASGNPDFDNDGIADICDQDDDNDGILDTNEVTDSFNGAILYSHNEASNPRNIENAFPELTNWVLTTTNDESYGSGISATMVGNELHLSDPGYATYADAFANDAYIEYSFTTSSEIDQFIFTQVYLLTYEDAGFNNDRNGDSFKATALWSTDNFATSFTLANGVQHGETNTPDASDTFIYLDGSGNPIVAQPNTTYSIRFYIFDYQDDDATKAYGLWDDIIITLEGLRFRDTDRDGNADYVDTDSDNDGCFDTVEAGHTDGDNDGFLDGTGTDADGQVTGFATGYSGATGNEIVATEAAVDTAPTNQSANEGSAASFTVAATATNTITFTGAGAPNYNGSNGIDSSAQLNYQWQENGAPLSDGGVYSGTGTATLVISNVTGLDGNTYTVIITHGENNCISLSESATLTTIDPCDALASGNTDTDGDGISDFCDVDDDNDGILDVNECDFSDSGLTGPLPFTFDITSSNPNDQTVPHILNSITYGGTTYSDFIVPDSYMTMFTVNDEANIRYHENGSQPFNRSSNPNFDNDVLIGFQSRNLNNYVRLESGEDYSNGDYSEVRYNTPILSTDGGFVAVTEQGGNNPQVIQALDFNGNVIGNSISVATTDYSDLEHRVNNGQDIHMALYPVDDLVTPGTQLYGIRISYGPSSTNDGADAKVFFFGNLSSVGCDNDGDGLANYLDLDSDNDGCFDTVEAGHSDGDNDGRLGNSPVSVDASGQVTGQGGYTGTNSAVTNAPIAVTFDTQPADQLTNIADNTSFTASVSGGAILSYQWQESTNNGTSWSDITDGGIYSGATTNSLTLTAVPAGEHDNDYRLVVTSSDNNCASYTSDAANLFLRPSLTVADASAAEGASLAFVVTPSHVVAQDITFDLTYTDVTTSATDYTPVASGVLGASATSVTINVPAFDDALIEADETFTLGMTNGNGFAGDISDTATGTITDNDASGPGQGISVADFTIGEGDGSVDFVISYVGPDVQDSFTMDYVINDDTANSGTDYTATLTGQVTFPAGTTNGDQQTITVTIIDDSDFESDETLDIILSNISNTSINFVDFDAEGTIQDDDSAGSVGFDNNAVIVTEGTDTFARFTVRFTGGFIPFFRTVVVDYNTTDGSAVAPGDYTSASGTLTFHSFNYSDNIDIPISDDGLIEAQESFNLILSNLRSSIGAVFVGGQPTETASGTINDNDGDPTAGLSVSDFTVNENAGTADFTITYNGATVQDAFTVDYDITDGTALAGSDYNATISGQLSFAAGTSNGNQQTVTINIADDTLVEDNETLNIQLSNLSTTLINLVDADGVGTINDNDGSPTTGLSVSDFTIAETGATADFIVYYNGATVQDGFTVDYTITDNTATSGSDYSATLSAQLTFPAGTTNGDSQNITVTIMDDTILEGDETLDIVLSNLSTTLINLVDPNAVGTINDDEMAGPTDGIAVSDFTVNENVGTVDFVVSYTGPSLQNAFTADYTFSDGTAISGNDFTAALTGQVSFPANTVNGDQQTITVTVIDDALIEGDEDLSINLTNLSTSIISLVDDTATGTITDNDVAAPTTGLSVADFSVNENAGTADFVVSYNGADVQSAFTVDYAISDGSATSGSDYTATLNGQLTFAAGTTNGDQQTVTVTITDDTIIEGDENLSILLSNLSTSLINLVDADAEGIILDDDVASPTTGLSVADISVNENIGSTQFVITYNGATVQSSFTVDYDITNGSAISGTDYFATLSSQITFPAGTINGDTQVVNVSIADDAIIEGDEDLNILLSNLSTPLLNLVDDSALGTIIDNDVASPTTGLSVGNFSVNENVGTANFVVTYNGPEVQQSFTADYLISDGTAISGSDFNATLAGQVIFPAGSTSGTQRNISVTILEDAIIEGNETLTVQLSNLSTTLLNLVDADGTGTIIDNDFATPATGLEVTDLAENENAGNVNFVVTYRGATVQNSFTVDYAIIDGTANFGTDFSGTVSGQLTFPAGTANGDTQNIPFSIIDDLVIEGNEDLSVQLSNLSTPLLNIVDGLGDGTIIDNDLAAPNTGLSVADFTVDESAGSTNFVITYNGATVQDSFTVDFDITDVTATNGTDYNAVANGTLTFPAGTSNGDQQSIAVTINEDVFIEQDEQLTFTLSNLSIYPIINIVDGNAVGTITDNDNTADKGIDFQNLSVSVTEGDPGDTVSATFTITFNGDLEAAEVVEVDYLVNGVTAFNSTDFTASPTPTTLTFTNAIKSRSITIPIINDNVIEPNEQFDFDLIAIRSNVGIRLLNNSAVGNIADDDGGTVSASGFTLIEQNTSVNFEVQYNGDTVTAGFTVDYVVTDGTATAGSDYTAPFASGSLTFTGNDNEVRAVTVDILQDNFIEFDENLQITISNASDPVVSIGTAVADGIIQDNDGGAIDVTGFTVNEVFTTENFEVTYTGDPIAGGFTVNYQIVDGSTTQGSDYTVSSPTGTLNFSGANGEVLQVPVNILQDALLEGNETLAINLTGVNPNLITITNNSASATIVDIDHQPTAVDDSFVVFQDNSNKALDVLPNDDFGFDGPAASNALQVVTNPVNGTVTVNNNGTPADQTDDYFDYAPSPTFNGSDSFVYSITDSNGSTVTATVNLYVNDTNLKKDFEIRYQGNIHGDFTMIANNVLSRNQTTAYNGEDGNHDFWDNVFVDIDSDPTTFNSTNANLVNPEPTLSCLNIERAYIYWAAADKPYDGVTGGGATEPTWNYNEIKLMLPGQSTYTTVAADEVLYRGRDESFQNDPYVCVKDITADVNALASPFGTYQVGNVKATEMQVISHGGGIIGTSGGWQIVFVYENISLDPKNITLYDGYVHTYASNGEGETEFNFSGFQTIPAGNVNTKMMIGSLEGDRDLGGDQFLINDTSNNWTNISTALRPSNNFFNSRITLDGANFVNRNVPSTNTLGFDAGKFQLNNTGNLLIGNDQTFARFKITTDQESYGLYLMGMSVDVYQPSLGALSLDANTAGPHNPGDIVPMTLNVNNVGNDDIQDLVISVVIPNEAEFSNVGTLPSGVTHSYDAMTRTLLFDVANGFINMGDAFDINFDIQLSPSCYYLETACTSSFPLQATATFSGVTNTDPITTDSSGTTDACGIGEHDPTIIDVQQPAQVNWATVANSLDRTVSCDDTAGLNAAQALEPVPASCNFILDKVAGVFTPAGACTSEGTYTNTWTFTDACGRISATYTQVITVEDNAAPTFNESLPADSFAAHTSVPSPQTLTANDNCDTIANVVFTETYIGDNTSTTYTIVRTWSTTDCAGNSNSHTQRIFVTEGGLALGLSIDDVTVNEGDGTATLTVLNTGDVSGGFTVNFSSTNGTAAEPADYVQTTGILNFSGAHNESQTITVTINDDNLLEPTEDLSILLTSGSNTPTINDDTGIITINDNDNVAGVGVSFDPNVITVTEGIDPAARFTVNFTGNLAPGQTVTVDFDSADGTAFQGQDYVDSSGTLTFSDTVTSIFVDVPLIDDNIIEPTENVLLTLFNVQSNVGVGFSNGAPVNSGLGNILDDDFVPGVSGLSFQADPVTVNEADGTATVNVVLTGNVQGSFTVDYDSADNTANSGVDYTAVSGTLTFAGNDGEIQSITIPIVDDVLIEPTEMFNIDLSNLSTALIVINDSQGEVEIIDNDNVPGVTGISFQNDPVTVNEGAGTVTVNVLLTGEVQGGFTIDYDSADLAAIAGADYTAVSGTLTFAGTDGEVQPIVIPIIDDTSIEPTERFLIDLSNLSTSLIAINDSQASVDIIDNDNIPGTTGISFQNDAITVNEADGTATVNVLLSGNVQGGFTIDFDSADNTALAGSDYTAVSGTLTFTGNDGEVHPITIPITDDNVIEPTEQLLIDLSNLSTTLIGINDSQATVDIIDNDNIPGTTGISFQTDPVVVYEADGTATLNVLLTGNVQGGFTVDYASADNSANAGADYTAVTGTLTFVGNDGEIQPIVVPITDDNFIEPTEQFLMNLLNLSTTLIAINDSQASVDIIDNDNIPGTGISFQNDAITVNEADGTATVNVLLTGNVQGGFTIDFDSADNTAIAGLDYTAVSGTLTFVGNNGEIQPIVIPITDDNVIEPTEQFLIDLSNLSTGLIGINDAQATVDIIDNDNIPGTTGISFQNDAITVNEADGTATVNVLLTGNVQGGFTIDFASADDSALAGSDYAAVTGTLTFIGNDGEIRPITIPIIDDNVIEPTERLLIDLSNLSTTLIAINDSQATVDILDNDNIPGTTGISFQNDAIIVNEADGTATINVLLTGNVQGGFTVDYTSADGSAENPSDYTAVSGTLTFTGVHREMQSITVPIIDDNVIEATERLFINLSNLSTTLIAINDAQATVDIVDNDNIPGTTGISFQNDAITVNEADGTATVNVLLTGNVQGGFTVDFDTADASAEAPSDYIAQSGTLTFAGNDGEIQPITITIIDDDVIEATERLLIDLTNLSTGLIAINDSQASIDIIDNDNIPGVTGISYQNDTVTVNEGDGTMTFDVVLTGSVQGGFSVNYASANGTAVQPSDYTSMVGTLNFVGIDGEVQTITIPIIDDLIIEPTEDLTVTLSGLSTTLITINGPSVGTGNIIDNDSTGAGEGISVADFTVDESVGNVNFVITYTGPDVQNSFTVDFLVADGTANYTSDYNMASLSGTVTFPNGTTTGDTQLVTVTILDDDIIEFSETLDITLSNISHGAIGMLDGNAIGTIDDNDAIPGVTGIRFDNNNVTVNEDAGTMTFDVVLTGSVQGGFTVDYATTDGTAEQPSDYTATTGTLAFVGIDNEVQTITIPIIDDNVIEFTENLTVTLSALSTPLITINGGNTATGNIIDNDAIPGVTGIRFDSDNVTVDEDAGTLTFDVVLTGNIQGGFTVDYATADGTAEQPSDYTQTIGTLTFVGNDAEVQTITIPIIDDDVIEFTEDLTATLSALSTTLITINGPDTATGNIVDNDAIPGVTGIRFDNNNVTVNEDAGTMTFDVVLTGSVQGGFTVDYATTDGTAEQPSDYTATTGTLAFVGIDNEVQTITIPIIDDNVIEFTEDLTVTLSALSTPLITINGGNTATGNIIDNDAIPGVTGIRFDSDNVTVDEDAGTLTFDVVLTGNVQGGFTVDYATADGTAEQPSDYTQTIGTLTFVGNDAEVQTITIPIIDDDVIEFTEDLTATLSALSTTLITINGPDTATGNIVDNDAIPGVTGIRFDNNNVTVNEDAGTMTFDVVLTGSVQGGFTVDYATTDGTAEQPSDYTTTTGTLTFVGIDTEVQTITIPIIDDNVIEFTEDLTVTLSALSTPLITINGGNTATGNIIDNDAIPGVTGIRFDSDNVTVDEDAGTLTFDVVLTGNVQGGFTVDYATADGTAEQPSDYTQTIGTLTFIGNDAEVHSVTIPIIDDTIIEETESFNLILSGLSTTLITINGTDTATGNIVDNDNIPGVTGLTIDDVIVDETDGTATLTVTLTGDVQDGLMAEFNTVDDTAEAGEDYTQSSGIVTFAGNDGETQSITIPITNDVLLETDELFMVVLSNLSTTATQINDDTGTITIIDDEFDTDGDLVPDIVDIDDDNDGILDTLEDDTATDSDGDGYPDSIDIDSDNDGIPDNVEAQTTSGYIPPTGIDSDNDGLDDAYEGAGDEGVTPEDTDGDGTDDFRDLDTDNDTVPDNNEGNDFNFDGIPDQTLTGVDSDGDGLDDGYEGSDVNDGFDVNDEIDDPANDLPDTDQLEDVNYRDIDDDGDGVNTEDEDPDGDGDPTNDDTDGDGIPDYLDPIDTDGDNVPDYIDIDDDNDGVLDIYEGDETTDTDGDSIIDRLDIDSDNDGIPDNVESQTTDGYIPPSGNDSDNDGLDDAYEGSGDEGTIPVDTDNDGTVDQRDLDSDNDNVPDNNEGNDFNFDGVPDQFYTGVDTDGDGLDDGYEGSDVNDGFDVNDEIDDPANDLPDTDGTEDVNYRDVDDDGDGIDSIDEDANNDGDPTNDDTDGDGTPDYLDPEDDRLFDPNFEDITIMCGDEIPAVPEIGDIGGCTDPVITFTEETIFSDDTEDYMIERTWYATDECGNEVTFYQTIFVMQAQLEEVFIDICVLDDPIDLTNYLPDHFDKNGTFTSITPGTYLNNTQFVPYGLVVGDYEVSYAAVNGTCTYYADIVVSVNDDCLVCKPEILDISKTVTPNGDGINEVFKIRSEQYCEWTFDVMIFNRWGDKVYEEKNYQNDWGGTAPDNAVGRSGILPAGTYYYIIDIVGSEFKPINGYIYLGNSQ
ncbi:Calx-beta domain-containing protein [Croceivirga thetidis]|uniref:T9SS type B sorting domain-containing protein n=1 Tax=Croceivirga thetidis TaxID=2721623 RepID=A0ABX1GX88_9FLAO|nr:Calx-beta domain-containing protein [Croceivirga thetidis]NKI33327.1 T9SS type B sorting domain-containing protein [Croceivirga thetidis]